MSFFSTSNNSRDMGTSAEEMSHRPQISCPTVCPLCGSAVHVAQCGWMRAMPVCENAQCLYPMVSELPAPSLVRPYTDMSVSPPGVSASVSPAKLNDSEADGNAASTEVGHLPIEPEEVFVHTLTEPERAGPASAAALTATLCGPVQRAAEAGAVAAAGPLAACLRAYTKALQLARASLHPIQPCSVRSVDSDRQFRNLEMISAADVQRSVMRELDSLDRVVAKPLSLSVTDLRDDFYDTLHRLFKSDKRLAKRFQSVHTLRQVCTVCFKQHVSRQKSTVLRLSHPAPDFDLFDSNKLVFLRPCQHCRAPQQRVLLRWERSSDGRQPIADAVFLEARDGLPGSIQLNKSLRTQDGLNLMPTAAVQRVAQSDNQFYCIVWLYSRDHGRWMRLGPNKQLDASQALPALACHDITTAPTFQPGELVALLLERECPPTHGGAAGAGGGTEPSSSFTTCDGSGRSSAIGLAAVAAAAAPLPSPTIRPAVPAAAATADNAESATSAGIEQPDDNDEMDLLAELFGSPLPPPPPPPSAPQPPATTAQSTLSSGAVSLQSRLQSVMASRRGNSTASSASVGAASVQSDPVCSQLRPAAGGSSSASSGRGFVLSRFLSSAARPTDERRLPSYSEDRHLLASDSQQRHRRRPAAAAAPQEVVEAALEPRLKRVKTAEQRLDGGQVSLLELAKLK